MRIAIVAQNASTKFGGESLLPLHYFRILRSRQIETWLVVHARTQAELEALFPEDCDRMECTLYQTLGYIGCLAIAGNLFQQE